MLREKVGKVQRIALYLCCEDKCRLVFGKLFREGSLADTTPAIEDDHPEAALGIEPLELTELMLASDKHAVFSLYNLDWLHLDYAILHSCMRIRRASARSVSHSLATSPAMT